MRTPFILRAPIGHSSNSEASPSSLVQGRARIVLSVLPIVISAAAVAISATPAAASEVSRPVVNAATVVSGVVTKNGAAVSGVEVKAQAWPSVELLGKLPADTEFHEVTVAEGVTDPEGRFAIAVERSSLGKDYISSTGSVDLALLVADAAHQIRWNFTATKGKNETTGLWGNPRVSQSIAAQRSLAGQAPVRLSIDLGDSANVVEEGNEPATWVGADGLPLSPAKALEAAKVTRTQRMGAAKVPGVGTNAVECTPWLASSEWQYGRTESYVQAVGTGIARPVAVQEVNTQHTMGVAGDALGYWNQNGTMTLSFGASAETMYPGGADVVYNKVNYRKYTMFCFGTYYSEWRPAGYYALNTGFGPLITPNWTTCTTYYNGTYTKNSGSNVTFGAGVNLTVLNVSAQAQFSNQTKMKWTFNGTGKLCGSNGSGWVSAPQAGAYP